MWIHNSDTPHKDGQHQTLTLRPSEAAPFIAVEVASTEASSAQPAPASGIEIRHRRGWSVIVEPDFDASHLRRLLAVLEMAS
jgi:hypothetical protein